MSFLSRQNTNNNQLGQTEHTTYSTVALVCISTHICTHVICAIRVDLSHSSRYGDVKIRLNWFPDETKSSPSSSTEGPRRRIAFSVTSLVDCCTHGVTREANTHTHSEVNENSSYYNLGHPVSWWAEISKKTGKQSGPIVWSLNINSPGHYIKAPDSNQWWAAL